MSFERPNGRPGAPLWQIGVGLVAAVLLVIGVGLLIAQAAGFGEVRDAIADARTEWLLICFVSQIAALAGYAGIVHASFRWRGSACPSFRLSAQVMLASIGATRVFALGAVGAFAATFWAFRRARLSAREAIVRVVGFNTLFYVLFLVGAWIAALLMVLEVWGEASLGLTVPWLVVVPALILTSVWATDPSRVHRLTTPTGSVLRRTRAYAISGPAWVRAVMLRPTGRDAFVSSAFYWVGNVVCFWAALSSIGESLPLTELVLAFATGHATTALPLPLGGVGGVDAAMTYALTLVGVGLAPALVAVAVYRLFAFWLPTIPALAAFALLPRAGRALEQAARVPT